VCVVGECVMECTLSWKLEALDSSGPEAFLPELNQGTIVSDITTQPITPVDNARAYLRFHRKRHGSGSFPMRHGSTVVEQ
jgi:hypothetical protein